jgi:hypothetical protein
MKVFAVWFTVEGQNPYNMCLFTTRRGAESYLASQDYLPFGEVFKHEDITLRHVKAWIDERQVED